MNNEEFDLKEFFTMKTEKELKELKEEAETVNKKRNELTEEELEQVTGGGKPGSLDTTGAGVDFKPIQ